MVFIETLQRGIGSIRTPDFKFFAAWCELTLGAITKASCSRTRREVGYLTSRGLPQNLVK